MMRRRVAAAVAAALLLAGCSPADGGGPAAPGDEPTAALTIASAASLAEAMATIAEAFERTRPGIDVRPIVSDGSATLATQIRAGAPYDVFVSADEPSMAGVAELVGEPVPLATNRLVIVVPSGNPGGVRGLADLADVSTVLCAPEVPCGAASARLLALHGLDVRPVSLEQSVRGVLAKVEADAVDAGLVYSTDAAASASVETIAVAGAEQVVNRAMAAVVLDSPEPQLAAELVRFIAGDEGRAVLDGLGFGAP
ncbi:molybdate ABC transporter substrate-binding protein [Agrococcus sp. KRD186]|jgi:molybdate transport system substrate-binding protein|uniref:molybdate ABC transporter substrate-binding protein n=1 Tax=Agrococcus sp. KRD186 TaxID=2729730 RepID=UPI003145608E